MLADVTYKGGLDKLNIAVEHCIMETNVRQPAVQWDIKVVQAYILVEILSSVVLHHSVSFLLRS